MQILTSKLFSFILKFAAPLKSFKYTIDIKFNASRDTVIERLRALIHGQKFPTCVKKGMKISGVKITTGKRSLRDVMTFCSHYSKKKYLYMFSPIS